MYIYRKKVTKYISQLFTLTQALTSLTLGTDDHVCVTDNMIYCHLVYMYIIYPYFFYGFKDKLAVIILYSCAK